MDGGAENPKFLTMAWSFQGPALIQEPTEGCFLRTRHSYHPPCSYKGFRNSVAGTGSKTNYENRRCSQCSYHLGNYKGFRCSLARMGGRGHILSTTSTQPLTIPFGRVLNSMGKGSWSNVRLNKDNTEYTDEGYSTKMKGMRSSHWRHCNSYPDRHTATQTTKRRR